MKLQFAEGELVAAGGSVKTLLATYTRPGRPVVYLLLNVDRGYTTMWAEDTLWQKNGVLLAQLHRTESGEVVLYYGHDLFQSADLDTLQKWAGADRAEFYA